MSVTCQVNWDLIDSAELQSPLQRCYQELANSKGLNEILSDGETVLVENETSSSTISMRRARKESASSVTRAWAKWPPSNLDDDHESRKPGSPPGFDHRRAVAADDVFNILMGDEWSAAATSSKPTPPSPPIWISSG
jgi:hypothetical protein